MSTQSVRIDSSTIVRTILFAALAVLLYELSGILLVVLTAIVIAAAIEPAVHFFENQGLPRILSVVVIYVLMALGVFVVVYALLPPVLADVSEMISQAPDYIRSLQLESSFLGQQLGTPEDPLSVSEIVTNLRNSIGQSTQEVFSFVSGIFGGVASFVLIMTLSFYLVARRGSIDRFLRIVIPTSHEEYGIDLWHRTQEKIGRWLQGQLVLMAIVGMLVYLGLLILGVPNALLLGIVAGIFEIIPLLGPILSAIPAILIAAIEGGLSLALMVTGLFIIVQQLENNLIHPMVVTKVVGVPPIVVILAIVVGGHLAGFLGILLAVPLAAGLMEFAHDVDKKKHSGGEEEVPPSDQKPKLT